MIEEIHQQYDRLSSDGFGDQHLRCSIEEVVIVNHRLTNILTEQSDKLLLDTIGNWCYLWCREKYYIMIMGTTHGEKGERK